MALNFKTLQSNWSLAYYHWCVDEDEVRDLDQTSYTKSNNHQRQHRVDVDGSNESLHVDLSSQQRSNQDMKWNKIIAPSTTGLGDGDLVVVGGGCCGANIIRNSVCFLQFTGSAGYWWCYSRGLLRSIIGSQSEAFNNNISSSDSNRREACKLSVLELIEDWSVKLLNLWFPVQ